MNRLTKASLLFFFFALCGVAIFISARVRERSASPAPQELYSVVNSQLAAFRAEDFPGAYRCATSAFQQKFTLGQFEAMIRRDYAQVTHARRVEFGPVQIRGAAAALPVYFFQADGSVRSFLYSLMAEGGSWKITGAEEIRALPPAHQLSGSHA